MKKLMNLSKLAIAALVTSSLFVACSEKISENTVDTKYTAQTGNLGNAGQAVDLGLPSGTLWANKNVGASSETDNGALFIWGDATGKKIDADNEVTYTDVTEITSFDELFNSFSNPTAKTDGVICDTTKIVQTEQPKLIDTSALTEGSEIRAAIQTFLKAKLVEATASSTGGLLEATLVNDENMTVIMNLDGGKYIERLPSDLKEEADKDKYYATYKYEKISRLTIEEINKTAVTYYVSDWANGNGNYTEIKDIFGEVIRKDYAGGTIGNSIKDITDDSKNNNLTFVPAYYITGDAGYDAATANWGGAWRMPTTAQLAELLNCCEWDPVDGGFIVTGPNGNYIFLPAAGYRYGDKMYGNDYSGYYASGEIISTYSYPSMAAQKDGSKGDYSSKENMPSVLMFQQGQYNTIGVYNNMSASYGFSIRPVATLLK
jgi:hypothetical protein